MSGETKSLFPSIFAYVDYRQYFRDYYAARNKQDRSFSHRFISEKLNDKSPSFFLKVLQGQRKLTDEQLEIVSSIFELNREGFRYLISLYRYGTAKDNTEREYHLGLMTAISSPNRKELHSEASDFYSEWYHSAIRALLEIVPVAEDPLPILKYLRPVITRNQAIQSIELLSKLNLIKRNSKGFWKPQENAIFKKSPIEDVTMRSYRLKCLDLAKHAVSDPHPLAPLQFYTTTMTVSDEALLKIQQQLAKFRAEVRAIVSHDTHAQTRVVQLQDALMFLSAPTDLES